MKAIYKTKSGKYLAIFLTAGFLFIISALIVLISVIAGSSVKNADYPPKPINLCNEGDRVIDCIDTPNFNCCENNTDLYCYNAFQLNGYLCLNITDKFRAYSAEINARHDEFGAGNIVATIFGGIGLILLIVGLISMYMSAKYEGLEKIAEATESKAAAD